MTAPDFAAIIKHAQPTEHVNSRSDNARDVLAAKVPELCSTCHGVGTICDLRCDNCGGSASLPLGMTCSNHLAKPTPCPDCPTIGKLLAIGAAVIVSDFDEQHPRNEDGSWQMHCCHCGKHVDDSEIEPAIDFLCDECLEGDEL